MFNIEDLAVKVANAISDHYDDDEYLDEAVDSLASELSALPENSNILAAIACLVEYMEHILD